jgi:hypothetical protein
MSVPSVFSFSGFKRGLSRWIFYGCARICDLYSARRERWRLLAEQNRIGLRGVAS